MTTNPSGAARLILLLGVGISGGALASILAGQVIPVVPGAARVLIRIFVLYFAIVVHEVSHGYVAYRLGDPTAKLMGRLTLNPLPHIDVFGSIIIPGFLILTGSPFMLGWAKPVRIDVRYLREPLRDFAVVAIAGPLSNFAQVALYVVLFRITMSQGWPNWIGFLAFSGVAINLFLGVFNMIPIPPLDGSRLLAAVLPTSVAVQYLSIERFGFIIVIAMLLLGAFERIFDAVWVLVLLLLG